jgi:hypothetical protein
VNSNNTTIVGEVVGVSGGVENGGKYIFVEQSIRKDLNNENQNFETINEFDSSTLGGDDVATFKRPKTVLYEFETGSAEVIGGGSVQLLSNSSGKVGVFTALTPDLRERMPLGESTSDARGRVGGSSRNSTLSGGGSNVSSYTVGQGQFSSISNLPPYVSMNYIIRIDPSASAAIIDTLEVKNIRLTNLPTTGVGSVSDTVFNDNGTLKIVT